MPATSPAGQPGVPSDWFASAPGLALLDSEASLVHAALSERPAPPWLWLAPVPHESSAPGRGVRLVIAGPDAEWGGAVRCALPFPFASQSLGTLVLQHVLGDREHARALLEECCRVLEPGGRLWLLALNPLSPYRWRWRGHGLRASEPLTWRRRLRAAGFFPDPVSQGIGPGWSVRMSDGVRDGPGLCAAYALRAEKRVAPLTPMRRKAAKPALLPQGAPVA